MIVYDLIDEFYKDILEKSKVASNSDTYNYPYAMGYFVSNIECMLDEMELSKKQLDTMRKYIDRIIKR
jgi:TATA-binding protein-associated factor Taf7